MSRQGWYNESARGEDLGRPGPWARAQDLYAQRNALQRVPPMYRGGPGFVHGPHPEYPPDRVAQVARHDGEYPGPVIPGSMWPQRVFTFPEVARPVYNRPIEEHDQVIGPAGAATTEIAAIGPFQALEGRVLEISGVEVNPAGGFLPGTDLTWDVLIDNVRSRHVTSLLGGFATWSDPARILVPIERNKRISLVVTDPVGGNRIFRGLIRGWVSPFTGAGSFAEGSART